MTGGQPARATPTRARQRARIAPRTSVQCKTKEASSSSATRAEAEERSKLSFILGTEAGMITPIVRRVQEVLQKAPHGDHVDVEIVFPVAADAVTAALQTYRAAADAPDGAAVDELCEAVADAVPAENLVDLAGLADFLRPADRDRFARATTATHH